MSSACLTLSGLPPERNATSSTASGSVSRPRSTLASCACTAPARELDTLVRLEPLPYRNSLYACQVAAAYMHTSGEAPGGHACWGTSARGVSASLGGGAFSTLADGPPRDTGNLPYRACRGPFADQLRRRNPDHPHYPGQRVRVLQGNARRGGSGCDRPPGHEPRRIRPRDSRHPPEKVVLGVFALHLAPAQTAEPGHSLLGEKGRCTRARDRRVEGEAAGTLAAADGDAPVVQSAAAVSSCRARCTCCRPVRCSASP
jgi:hypothetical protein